MKERCIMPEMPYCPACEYGYVEYLNETDTVWHCMVPDNRKKENIMSLGEAIGILKTEKDACDLKINNGNGNENDMKFSQAVDVVMDWVDKMYTALMRLN